MIDRRSFLIGSSAVVVAAALPAAATSDPLVIGIRYQTWPWGEPRPFNDWCVGSVGGYGGELKPLSALMPHLDKHFRCGPLWWEPIFPVARDQRGGESQRIVTR